VDQKERPYKSYSVGAQTPVNQTSNQAKRLYLSAVLVSPVLTLHSSGPMPVSRRSHAPAVRQKPEKQDCRVEGGAVLGRGGRGTGRREVQQSSPAGAGKDPAPSR
jgi:hypothetical protein